MHVARVAGPAFWQPISGGFRLAKIGTLSKGIIFITRKKGAVAVSSSVLSDIGTRSPKNNPGQSRADKGSSATSGNIHKVRMSPRNINLRNLKGC
jgi:hypothetical protein